MRYFRTITIILAVINIVGELFRSWGDGRHIVWVMDDVLIGLFLIISALTFTKDTPPRRAFFAAAWGASLGMIYYSFFSSLLEGAAFNSGNFDWRFLTAVKGLIFLISITGLICAIRLPYKTHINNTPK